MVSRWKTPSWEGSAVGGTGKGWWAWWAWKEADGNRVSAKAWTWYSPNFDADENYDGYYWNLRFAIGGYYYSYCYDYYSYDYYYFALPIPPPLSCSLETIQKSATLTI